MLWEPRLRVCAFGPGLGGEERRSDLSRRPPLPYLSHLTFSRRMEAGPGSRGWEMAREKNLGHSPALRPPSPGTPGTAEAPVAGSLVCLPARFFCPAARPAEEPGGQGPGRAGCAPGTGRDAAMDGGSLGRGPSAIRWFPGLPRPRAPPCPAPRFIPASRAAQPVSRLCAPRDAGLCGRGLWSVLFAACDPRRSQAHGGLVRSSSSE